MTKGRLGRWGLGIAIVALVGVGVLRVRDRVQAQTVDVVPTTKLVRGKMDVRIHATGELRTGEGASLLAPSISGGLNLVSLVPTGTRVKTGDVVMEFDAAEQTFNLDQSRSELAEAELEIEKLNAETAVQVAQGDVDLLQARFDLRRAELTVTGNRFIGTIEAKKNELTLEESKRRLTQLEQDVKTKAQGSRAALALLREKRAKAALAMQHAERQISLLVVRAPLDGVVAVNRNNDAAGGFMYAGIVLPEFKAGDTVRPGRAIADVVDLDSFEVVAKIAEMDRAQVTAGRPAEIRIDSMPGVVIKAKVRSIAGLAERQMWRGRGTPQFDVSFDLSEIPSTLRPGLTTAVTLTSEPLDGVVYAPRQAVHQRGGKSIVFVKNGSGFEEKEVVVKARSESHVAFENLPEGTEVALADPGQDTAADTPSGAPRSLVGG